MAKKVAIVDDSRTARQQVKNALGDAGYEVVEAVDGSDGLRLAEETADLKLVICDINMPNMNGLDMLAKLVSKFGSRLEYLMLSTEAEPALVQKAKQAGAKGWIVKPFKPDMLVSTVKKLIGDP